MKNQATQQRKLRQKELKKDAVMPCSCPCQLQHTVKLPYKQVNRWPGEFAVWRILMGGFIIIHKTLYCDPALSSFWGSGKRSLGPGPLLSGSALVPGSGRSGSKGLQLQLQGRLTMEGVRRANPI